MARWDGEDAVRFYGPCALLFGLGFLAKAFGVVGFVLFCGAGYLAARYLAAWTRRRFHVATEGPEDRLDAAMRQDNVTDAVRALIDGGGRRP